MRFSKKKLSQRISMFIASCVLISSVPAIPVFAKEPSGVKGDTCYVHGDVNADGLVTSKDPIQILYASMSLDSGNTTEQSLDFNNDGKVDKDDAIHLLYSIDGWFGDLLPEYQLKGVIHAYGEPTWHWHMEGDTPVVAATYRCACGQQEGEVYGTVEKTDSTAPTCTEAGSVTYSATATFADVTYSTTKTVVVDATGHRYAEGTNPCEERACTKCGYTEKAAAHNFGEPVRKDATCTEAATDTYTCQDCGYSYTVKSGNALGHTLDPNSLVERELGSHTCKFEQVYTCSVCNEEVVGQQFEKHSYVATVSKEATCTEAGIKTYTCTECNHTYDVEIPENQDAHTWDAGSVSGNITTYTCTNHNCNVTRTTVNASNQTSTTVSKDTLSSVGEVELKGASVKLDDTTLSQLGENVGISATTVAKEELNISNAQKDQIGNNPVYDFSMTSDETTVSQFNGLVTITLPYELQSGDDVDCIDVWFIDDNGEVEIVQGTYSNGYVTFTTNHFSYYTVTRLTPAERCEAYGHSEATQVVPATCEEDGYTLHVCKRCTKTWKEEPKQRLDHDYKAVTIAATCEEAGSVTETCTRCNDVRTTILPKTGHNWVEDGEGTPATCSQSGSQTYKCENCNAEKTELSPQLSHKLTTGNLVPATCESKGYTLRTCELCGYEVTENEIPATGHAFTPKWSWDVDGGNISAVVTLTCENDETHVVTKNGVVDIKKQVPSTCSKEGSTIYSATVSYNQEIYSDEYTVPEGTAEHKPAEEWKYGSANHYHVCTLCGGKVDLAAHELDEGVATTEATCTDEGVMTYTCVCGYKTEEAIPALAHEFQDGVCTRCDFKTNECTHENFHVVVVELTEEDGVCPAIYEYETCDCGQEKHLLDWNLECEINTSVEFTKDANGYVQERWTGTCEKCNAVLSDEWSWEITGKCEGTQHYQCTLINSDKETVFELHSVEAKGIQHPTAVYVEEKDLTEYGLCGGSALVMHCPCGQDKNVYLLDDACNWVSDFEHSGEGKDVYHCTKCEIDKVITWRELGKNGCQTRMESVVTYEKGGETKVTFENQFTYEEHNLKEEIVLDNPNGSCLDGFTVKYTCSDCGFTDSWHQNEGVDHHPTYAIETVDLSQYPGCNGTLIRHACPCGEETYVWEDTDCQMVHDSYSEEETKEGLLETETYICKECGLKRQETTLLKPTEHECTLEGETITSYWMGEEKLLEHTSHRTRHEDDYNMCIDYQVNGTTCEDGASVTEECTLCGVVFEREVDWHHIFTKERYNLADYGMCGGELIVRGCACGEEAYINERMEDGCDWNWWYYDEATNAEVFKCQNCGMLKYESYEEQYIGGCRAEAVQRYEYLKGYNVVLSVEAVGERDRHDEVYNFVLDIENGTCSDGFTVYVRCNNCDYQNQWHDRMPEGEHVYFDTEVIALADYGFCGGELRHVVCPCGAGDSWNRDNWNNGCDWNWYRFDEATDTTWFECSDCGGFYSESSEILDSDGCYENRRVTYTFYDKDETEKLSVQSTERRPNHQYQYEYVLKGKTCSDGFRVNATCQICGETDSWEEHLPEGEHRMFDTAIYDLREKGFCGGTIRLMECPCEGQSGFGWDNREYCDFKFCGRDEETGVERVECTRCQGAYTVSRSEQPVEGCFVDVTETYTFFSPNGSDPLSFDVKRVEEHHNNTYSFKMNGDSCLDGYEVTSTCKTCGVTSTRYNNWHEEYLLETVELPGFCGSIERRGCACGENSHTYQTPTCRWEWNGYDDATHATTWTCSVCGNKRIVTRTEGEKNDRCELLVTEHTAYVNMDGETVYAYDHTDIWKKHDYLYKYELQGQTCEDGYYAIGTCWNCGDVMEEPQLETEHMTRPVERVDLSEKGLCGGTVTHYSCACGRDGHWSYEEACNWGNYSEKDNTQTWTCSTCGAVKERSHTSEMIDLCHVKNIEITTYSNGDAVLCSFKEEYINENHDCDYALSLKTPDTTCDEGYVATGICKNCNNEIRVEGRGHRIFCIKTVELKEHGFCGGVYREESCACGQDHYYNMSGENCDWMYQSTEEDGTKIAQCQNCGGTRKVTRTETEKDENCNVTVTRTYAYSDKEGKEVLQYTDKHVEERHDYELLSYEMYGESCEDGYTEHFKCKACGQERIERNNYHNHNLVTKYDLSRYGVCEGSTLTKYSCYCGQSQRLEENIYGSCNIMHTNNNYVDESGNRHEVMVMRCENCDLRVSHDRTSVRDSQTCTEHETEVITITVGDAAVDSFMMERTYTSHDYEKTATLIEGAITCEDGVRVTRSCKDCGYKEDYEQYYHEMFEVADSREDLSQYGSVCGGYVVQEACACGQRQQLVTKDTACDFDYQYETPWLGDNLSGQVTTEGSFYPSRNACVKVCAVTDPEQCHLVIRECNYYVWDKENCCAEQYVTWQLGYDRENGTYQKEITIKIGETRAYHDYEVTYSEGNSDLGKTLTETQTCKTCGSTHVETTTYNSDGNWIRTEKVSTNTLNNGEAKSRTEIHECTYYQGYQYPLLSDQKKIYADDTESWNRWEYIYDWDNFDCTRICKYSDSNGTNVEQEEECHNRAWSTESRSTCTQYGNERWYCQICDKTIERYPMNPNGHYWQYDSVKGVYECMTCHLENSNGADGQIVVEDLTATYGENDTSYVVGYWNKGNVQYGCYLSVICNEIEEGEIGREIVLSGIEFNEMTREANGINAISFNQDQAKAVAQAAANEAGYSGAYDLRFAFVPVGSDGSFDYAITFTDEM